MRFLWDALWWEVVEALWDVWFGSNWFLTNGQCVAACTRGFCVYIVSLNLAATFAPLAVKVKGEYVVAGKGKISLNVSYPSVLEDRQIKYKVFLTENNLPSLEEVHVDGPTQEEIEIQVNKHRVGKGPVRTVQAEFVWLCCSAESRCGRLCAQSCCNWCSVSVMAFLFLGRAEGVLPTSVLQAWGMGVWGKGILS